MEPYEISDFSERLSEELKWLKLTGIEGQIVDELSSNLKEMLNNE